MLCQFKKIYYHIKLFDEKVKTKPETEYVGGISQVLPRTLLNYRPADF